jgi:hypothetical protein
MLYGGIGAFQQRVPRHIGRLLTKVRCQYTRSVTENTFDDNRKMCDAPEPRDGLQVEKLRQMLLRPLNIRTFSQVMS